MRTKQPGMPNGVIFRPKLKSNPYEAWVKSKGAVISLGYYKTPEQAAVVADVSRYLLWGTDHSVWKYKDRRRTQNPPSSEKITNLAIDPTWIISKLIHYGCVNMFLVYKRLAALKDRAAAEKQD